MKRFATSMLALGLAASIGTASAQSAYSANGYPNGGYYDGNGNGDDNGRYDDRNDGYDDGGDRYQASQPSIDRYGNRVGAHYDTARVVRVDPVIEPGDGSGGYANGYGQQYPSSQQRCYTRQDGTYVDNRGDDGNGYRNDGYGDGSNGNRGYGNGGYDNYRAGGTDTGRSVATVIGGVLGAALGSRVGGGSARYATAALGTVVGGIAGREIYDGNNRYATSRTGNVTVCDPVPVDSRYSQNDARVAGYDVTYEYAGRRYTTRTDFHPGDTIRVRVDVRPE